MEMKEKDSYLLDLPAIVLFSGGRTSGLMLWNILKAHDEAGWERPDIVFQNTGKERPETLDFVEETSRRWSVPIVWLEYRFVERKHSYAIVNYESASRNGEPFDQAIASRNNAAGDGVGYLPNRVARYCTSELKVKTCWRWARDQSKFQDSYTKAVGLRADESERVRRILTKEGRDVRLSEVIVCPLADAGVRLDDVMAFWKAQPFDLQLQPHEGNCDLCFLKRKSSLLTIMRDRPDLAKWWIDQENDRRRFRSSRDRPRYELLLLEARQPQLFDELEEEDDISCACTD